MTVYKSADWNKPEDDFTHAFHEELKSNIWHPEEIPISNDKNVWRNFPSHIQNTYAKNLMLLTNFDTQQGDLGMPLVSRMIPASFHQRKAFFNLCAWEENGIHAKSYSNIFETLLTKKEEADIKKWGEENEHVQALVSEIIAQYRVMNKFVFFRDEGILDETSILYRTEMYKTLVNSVFLESFLFYSGFFYPLYFYAQGKLMQCGEMINLIIRDELLHGVYTSMVAKEVLESFPAELKDELLQWAQTRVKEIYAIQQRVIYEMYHAVDLVNEVEMFCRYNANKALMHLNIPVVFSEEVPSLIVQTVINGLNTQTKDFDYFSMKGNGYHRIKIEKVIDSDFDLTHVKRIVQ